MDPTGNAEISGRHPVPPKHFPFTFQGRITLQHLSSISFPICWNRYPCYLWVVIASPESWGALPIRNLPWCSRPAWLLSVRQLKAGSSALHKFFQEASETISRNAANFSCWRDQYLTVLWSDQSPRLRFSLSRVPIPGTGRMSHVPDDAVFQMKGENSFLYSGGSQDPARTEESQDQKDPPAACSQVSGIPKLRCVKASPAPNKVQVEAPLG